MTIEKLLGTLFLSREVSHREHLKTKSDANHRALEEFYDSILDCTDAIAEAYMGRHGVCLDVPILTEETKGKDISTLLRGHLTRVEKYRYTAIERTDTSIQGIMDATVAKYLKVLFKLNNLK